VSSSDGGDMTYELCRITLDQFSENTTVTGVAQSVVDKIVRMHREQFEMENHGTCMNSSVTYREDMSLMVRNFNAKLAMSRRKRSSMSSATGDTASNANNSVMSMMRRQPGGGGEDTITSKSTTTEGSEGFLNKNVRELPVDEDGRIKPYVDFSHFNGEWAKAQADSGLGGGGGGGAGGAEGSSLQNRS
jgi:TAK1-binding protein 1